MAVFDEIQRMIQLGCSDREIARTLHCRRKFVAEVRLGEVDREGVGRAVPPDKRRIPDWVKAVDWDVISRDLIQGFEIKRIWEETASALTTYSNFYRTIQIRLRELFMKTVTLREFNPGEHCEVDYAGDGIEWISRNGEIKKARVFVGILCFSQKIFAIAHENEQKANWLHAHRKMFETFGGTPRVVVPDCLKNGVRRVHLYDPDINQDYVAMAKHYSVAVLPARVRHPKDKALVENAVGLIMRLFKFVYRRQTFRSLDEVNEALAVVLDRINNKPHSRFKVSRQERFETLERGTLKSLPLEPYGNEQWKTLKLHPDCTVVVMDNFYSAPHCYRGESLRVKITDSTVEIFRDLERVAIHARRKRRDGTRIVDPKHLPEASRAYLESTPQSLLARAKFCHPELHSVVKELLEQDPLSHLRRCQGLIRRAYQFIEDPGHGHGHGLMTRAIKGTDPLLNSNAPVRRQILSEAIAQMKRFNRIRVRHLEEYLRVFSQKYSSKSPSPSEDRSIQRKSCQELLRRNRGDEDLFH